MDSDCESYLIELSDVLRGRARLAAEYVCTVLEKRAPVTRMLLESCFREYEAKHLDPTCKSGIAGHISAILGENPGQHYPTFLGGTATTLVDLLQNAAALYQLSGCYVPIPLEQDLVERALLIVKRVDGKTIHYEFGEPLVARALSARPEFSLAAVTSDHLRSVLDIYGRTTSFKVRSEILHAGMLMCRLGHAVGAA